MPNVLDNRPLLGISYDEEFQKYSTWQNLLDNEINTFTDFFIDDNVGNNINDNIFSPDVDVKLRVSFEEDIDVPLTKYYDKILDEFEYNNSQSPTETEFSFFPREPGDLIDSRELLTENLDNYYIAFVDWGDGSPLEFTDEPHQLSSIKHHFDGWGLYTITGYMLFRNEITSSINIPFADTVTASVINVNFKKFSLNIFLNKREEYEDEFDILGGGGYKYIPYNFTTPIIGGISKRSLYYKTLKKISGFVSDNPIPIDLKFMDFRNRLSSQIALYNIDENKAGKDLDKFDIIFDEDENITYNGLKQHGGELGVHIGDTDIGQVRVFINGNISMHEMLGMNDETAKPDSNRYWENIIPDEFIPTDRMGVTYDEKNDIEVIDELDSQVWVNNYYYPVLPKLNQFGKFDETLGLQNNNFNIPFGSVNRKWDEEDFQAPITSITIDHPDLIYDADFSEIIDNTIADNSGNKNLGILINDYKLKIQKEKPPKKVTIPLRAKIDIKQKEQPY